MPKNSGIYKTLKHIISNVLLIAVLLPFAVQFVHSFEYHEHICNEHDIHIDTHQLDCAVFHFKINQNSIDLSSEEIVFKNTFLTHIIFTIEESNSLIKLHYKSSRAPPYLLL